jgi:uncharacterized protein (DUF488 family)
MITEDMDFDKQSETDDSRIIIYTVGHSNHEPYKFIRLLALKRIELVVDVRSIPFSKTVPQFNKLKLETLLRDSGIEYRFGGKYLGAYPDGVKPSRDKPVDWGVLSERPEFKKGISRLLELAQTKCTALLCAEENPHRCHRHHLIMPALRAENVRVIHIRRDGTEEDVDDNPQQTLF